MAKLGCSKAKRCKGPGIDKIARMIILKSYNNPAIFQIINSFCLISLSLKATKSIIANENISRRLAIVLDSEVLIAPRLQARISNAAQITGLDSLTQAQEYARIFNSGQLPFKLNFEEIRMAE